MLRVDVRREFARPLRRHSITPLAQLLQHGQGVSDVLQSLCLSSSHPAEMATRVCGIATALLERERDLFSCDGENCPSGLFDGVCSFFTAHLLMCSGGECAPSSLINVLL
jgi:hypothetical protein